MCQGLPICSFYYLFILNLFVYLFIYMVVLSLSCGVQDL